MNTYSSLFCHYLGPMIQCKSFFNELKQFLYRKYFIANIIKKLFRNTLLALNDLTPMQPFSECSLLESPTTPGYHANHLKPKKYALKKSLSDYWKNVSPRARLWRYAMWCHHESFHFGHAFADTETTKWTI